MSVFDLDIWALTWNNIATEFRQAINYAWLKCLVAPCMYLQGLFDTNRAKNLYYLAHNGQVCHLEALLNDAFDNIAREIVISDPMYYDPVYLPLVSECPPEEPVWLGLVSEADPVWLPLSSEVGVDDNCFIIYVTTEVAGNPGYSEVKLRALVDEYRLPGKNNYTVVIF